MDVLSDILDTARIRGRLYFPAAFAGPWSVELPQEGRALRFHLVVAGHAWLSVGARSELLEAGDIAAVPHGAAQILRDDPARPPRLLADVLVAAGFSGEGELRVGQVERAPPTRLICGFCTYVEALRHPLLDELPDLLVIRRAAAASAPWLAQGLGFLSQETERLEPGHRAIADRLFEILLAEVLRSHLREGGGGFLAALADPGLGRALSAMHRAAARAWTVEELAGEAGLSRSRFAERFRAAVGQPPLHYLAEWRLTKASSLLLRSQLSVAEIAHRVGYDSLPSFTRRFAKRYGRGPGQFRRDLRATA